jgi:hypothetical protein
MGFKAVFFFFWVVGVTFVMQPTKVGMTIHKEDLDKFGYKLNMKVNCFKNIILYIFG